MPHSYEKEHSNICSDLNTNGMEQLKKSRFNGESMGNALALVKQGISLREAAKSTNLAYATVRRYWLKKQQQLKCNNNDTQIKRPIINNKTQRKQMKMKYDWNKMFTSEQELQLAEMCKGATVQQCRKLIYQMAIENNVRMNPKWHMEQLAGRDWLAQFQIRQRAILLDESYSNVNAAKDEKINEPYHLPMPIKTELIEENHNPELQINIWDNNYNNADNMINVECNIDEKNPLSSPPLPSLTPLENNHENVAADCSSPCKSNDNVEFDISKNFQNGLLNVLNHIATLAAKEKDKDPDELFLMSLLPSLRKVKEEDKLKAKIELIKVLDHF